MMKFICDGGTFDVQTSKEWRTYNKGHKKKFLEITVTSQDENIDSIEKIVTDPFPESFKIINEVNGNVVGTYEGYDLGNLSRMVEGNSVAIVIGFFKEEG